MTISFMVMDEIDDIRWRKKSSLEELWNKFAPPCRGQHFLEVHHAEHPDDAQAEDDEGRLFGTDLLHPRDCEESEPGDGRGSCPLQWLYEEDGAEDFLKDRSGGLEVGLIPVMLEAYEYGGYWEPREFDAYMVEGYEVEKREREEQERRQEEAYYGFLLDPPLSDRSGW